jgi:hypothetical protein
MRMRRTILAGCMVTALAMVLVSSPAAAGAVPGRDSVWRGDCGPYGHRGPWGGCIPGGRFGAGNYYFLGPGYNSPWAFVGPPTYGEPPRADAPPNYGPGYWGTRSYDIPAFQ